MKTVEIEKDGVITECLELATYKVNNKQISVYVPFNDSDLGFESRQHYEVTADGDLIEIDDEEEKRKCEERLQEIIASVDV